MRYFRISTLSFLAILLLFSCKKDEEELIQPMAPVVAGPLVGELNAMLGKRYYPSSNYVSILVPSGFAIFRDSLISDTTLDAGTVICESDTFIKENFQNSPSFWYRADYSWYLTMSSFGPTVDWQVSGGKHVPAINVSIAVGFPYVSEPIADTVDVSKPFTLICDSIVNADSITIITPWINTNLSTNTFYSGTTSSFTFSPADMSGIAHLIPGYVSIVVFAHRYEIVTTAGRSHIFRNTYSVTKEFWFE